MRNICAWIRILPAKVLTELTVLIIARISPSLAKSQTSFAVFSFHLHNSNQDFNSFFMVLKGQVLNVDITLVEAAESFLQPFRH
jgi:hypothetical protein